MRHLCDAFELPDPFAIEDCAGVAVAETPNHAIKHFTYRVICEAYNAKRRIRNLDPHPPFDDERRPLPDRERLGRDRVGHSGLKGFIPSSCSLRVQRRSAASGSTACGITPSAIEPIWLDASGSVTSGAISQL